jgi:Na+/H+ antiporter NhaC
MIKYIVLLIVSGITSYFLRDYTNSLSYDDFKPTLSTLLTISSIIFAIIGAWIAIIYPKSLTRSFRDNSTEEQIDHDKEASYLAELVEIVMVSAVVLMIVLAIQLTVPILKELSFSNSLKTLKHIGFFTIITLCFSQFFAIFRVIITNYVFLNKLRSEKLNKKTDKLHE